MKIRTKFYEISAVLALGVGLVLVSFFIPAVAEASSPAVTTNAAYVQSGTRVTLHGFVDPRDLKTSYWFELGYSYGSFTVSYPTRSTRTPKSIKYDLYNAKPGQTYYVRLVAQNKDGRVYGETVSFTMRGSSSPSNTTTNTTYTNTTVTNSNGTVTIVNSGSSAYRAPSMVTSFATNVTDGSFTMNGFIDPNGGTSVYRWFEWGDTEALGNSSGYISITSAPTNFSFTLTGVQPNKTYYYRAMGRNQYGIGSGNIYSVKTGQYGTGASSGGVAAIAVANSGVVLGNTSLQLSGTVVPGSTPLVGGYFEWGTTQNLGNATPLQSVNAAQATKLNHTIGNLSPKTTYYYRVVAQDSANRTYRSAIMSMTTGAVSGGSVAAGAGSGSTQQGNTSTTGGTAVSSGSKISAPTKNTGAAGVIFSQGISGILGWFFAILFFITSVVLLIVLHSSKKQKKEDKLVFPEFPQEFLPQNIK